MSTLKVDQISNKNDNGAPIFTQGVVVSPGYALTCSGGISISGVMTATSYSGDGSTMTNIAGVTVSKAYALKKIFHYDETLST